ncbi:MAG: glycosyltransferase family 4 protein [Candidatus Sumerlaeia bacterium]|nr:glycosyltransferase family 4 protein [Candidatus Sumerlaeia bacterium]
MRSIKILHTNFLRGWGGQSNRILLECAGLQERGQSVMISAPPLSELTLRAKKIGIPVFTEVNFLRGFHPVALWQDARKLRRLIVQERFDIIHTHGSQDSWAIALAVQRKTKPIIVRTKHNLFPIKNHIFNRWLYGKFFDHIVCISEQILRDCATKEYISQSKLSLIYSAIAPEKLRSVSDEEKIATKTKLGLGNEFIIGTVARLRPEKGLDILLKAMPEVIRQLGDVKLLIVGQGSEAQTLQHLARSLGIADKVIFAGFTPDIAPLLEIMHLFVMPSLSEGLGTAIIEAAARGLPIVASRGGGILDIIEHNVSGILVKPGDSQELATAIISLATSPELARRLALTASKISQQKFSLTQLVEKSLQLYRALISEKEKQP